MKKSIILIKIGGSLITDKNKPFTVNNKALDIIAGEIKKATSCDDHIILGHGAGSFAHIPAKKYSTHLGFQNKSSQYGMAETAARARELNQIVVEKLLSKKVNAVSVSPLSMMTAKDLQLNSLFTQPIEVLLEKGLLPVVYGDPIADISMGSTIFSTEKVLGYLGLALKEKGYKIKQIIHCGQTNGVYDEDGHTISLINSTNFPTYKSALKGSSGTDVTGGMIHKVEETLTMARQGIPGLIIDGIENGSLSEAIAGRDVVGTKVEA